MEDIKIFTVEEANELLPLLTEMLYDLKDNHENILRKQAEIDALELIMDRSSDAGLREIEKQVSRLNDLMADFNLTLEKVQHQGCLVKDVETGLIDFYAVMDGEVVYLCWKLGESRVEHWHPVGEGFAARKRIFRAE